MDVISMFNVISITGPNQGRGRICYICELGSAPVIVAFIKPESGQEKILIEAIQRLYDKHKSLQAFIVLLGGPEEGLQQRLKALAEEGNLTIPLTVLPEGGLPDSIPVDPGAENTVLLYRGRQIVKKLDNVNFGTLFSSQDSSAKLFGLKTGASSTPLTSASLDSSAAFVELDKAAADMLSRP